MLYSSGCLRAVLMPLIRLDSELSVTKLGVIMLSELFGLSFTLQVGCEKQNAVAFVSH